MTPSYNLLRLITKFIVTKAIRTTFCYINHENDYKRIVVHINSIIYGYKPQPINKKYVSIMRFLWHKYDKNKYRYIPDLYYNMKNYYQSDNGNINKILKNIFHCGLEHKYIYYVAVQANISDILDILHDEYNIDYNIIETRHNFIKYLIENHRNDIFNYLLEHKYSFEHYNMYDLYDLMIECNNASALELIMYDENIIFDDRSLWLTYRATEKKYYDIVEILLTPYDIDQTFIMAIESCNYYLFTYILLYKQLSSDSIETLFHDIYSHNLICDHIDWIPTAITIILGYNCNTIHNEEEKNKAMIEAQKYIDHFDNNKSG